MHLDPDLHPDERDTKQTNKQQTNGRTNIDYGDPSTQKAPKGAKIMFFVHLDPLKKSLRQAFPP